MYFKMIASLLLKLPKNNLTSMRLIKNLYILSEILFRPKKEDILSMKNQQKATSDPNHFSISNMMRMLYTVGKEPTKHLQFV